jgi:DNA-binding XRE family transcriptional regulator
MANDRDPRSDLGAWLGEELRGARLAGGYTSQDQFARGLGFDRTVVVKAETGARPPSDEMAAKIAEMFPGLCNGLYVRLVAIARKSSGPIPGWFADWLTREREAASIRIWQPIIIPGLLQTADYARALFVGERQSLEGDALEELVTARLARQAIFDKPAAPHLWVVLDEPVLHRLIGTGKIMHDQLVQLADLAERPCISIQVIPASSGAHAGLACAFLIGSADGEPDLLLVEAIEDQTIKDPEVVRKAAVAFDLVRGDALPRGSSQDLILKVAEGKWNI